MKRRLFVTVFVALSGLCLMFQSTQTFAQSIDHNAVNKEEGKYITSNIHQETTLSAMSERTSLSVNQLHSLAKAMSAPLETKEHDKKFLATLATLKPNDVLMLKKMWRSELVVQGVLTKEQSQSFPLIEKFESIFAEKIKDMFGPHATIFNISSEKFSMVEKALKESSEVSQLLYLIQNILEQNSFPNDDEIVPQSSCYYNNNWPQWLSSVNELGGCIGGGVGRVSNTPNEWPCDFVIYIPANTYTKVTGYSWAAQLVVSYSGGLSASPSKDAVIVGYGRVALFGFPTESWVRNYILFKY